jgi:hypothetical protein
VTVGAADEEGVALFVEHIGGKQGRALGLADQNLVKRGLDGVVMG